MHPVERLRYVARSAGLAEGTAVAIEAASAFAEMGDDEVEGLVPACRRLIDRHPANGALWWLSARVLTASEPWAEARDAGASLAHDPTERRLATALPDDQTVLAVGWPEVVADALVRRADLEVLVVDGAGAGSGSGLGAGLGSGSGLYRRLQAEGSDASMVPTSGVASAATVAGLVVVEAVAAGPTGILAEPGCHAAAAVAQRRGVPVWAVIPVGRLLPEPLWQALLARLDQSGVEPWDREVELVPAELVNVAIGPDGPLDVAALGFGPATCPAPPELLGSR